MKNRFCRRTKISEESFVVLVIAFSFGMTAVQACEFMAARGYKVSRQSIEKKFLELGEYIFRNRTRPASLREMKKANPDTELTDNGLEELALKMVWKRLRGDLDYAAHRQQGIIYPGPDLLIELLKERWRKFNGLNKSTLRSHVGFAAWLSQPSHRNNPKQAAASLLNMLTENPL